MMTTFNIGLLAEAIYIYVCWPKVNLKTIAQRSISFHNINYFY
jgi:hypothetical protein